MSQHLQRRWKSMGRFILCMHSVYRVCETSVSVRCGEFCYFHNSAYQMVHVTGQDILTCQDP